MAHNKSMFKPNRGDMRRLEKFSKYPIGEPRMRCAARHQAKPGKLGILTIALPSGKAVCHSFVENASIRLGLRSVLRDLEVDFKIKLSNDATVGKDIISPERICRVKHIEVNQL